jgi:hypothetical protein
MRDVQAVLTDELGLDLTGWELRIPWAVSADGLTIVGEGYNPNGDREAWIAHIPEPSTLVLLALGAFALPKRSGYRPHRTTA